MPTLRKSRRSVEDQVKAELKQIRANVAGVRGSLVATSDGLVVAHDIPDIEPTQIAALAAATLAVARRATLATECGTFREAVARGSDGYLAVYAAGDSAIVAVIGTSGLNVGMLQYRAREIIERIAAHSSQIGALAAPHRHRGRSRPPVPLAAQAPPADSLSPAFPAGAALASSACAGRQEPGEAGRARRPRSRPAAPFRSSPGR